MLSRPCVPQNTTVALGTPAHHISSNDDPGVTTYFVARSNLVTGFSIGKSENNGFFRNYCSL